MRNEREAFVAPATFKEFDRAIKKLKRNPALLAKVGKAAEIFAKKHYTLKRMVDEFEYLLSPVD